MIEIINYKLYFFMENFRIALFFFPITGAFRLDAIPGTKVRSCRKLSKAL